MEIKETLALVPTVIGGIKTIKETCDSIDVGFLPHNKQKLNNLKEQVKELEEKIQLGFPQLASLTKAYAEVSAGVRVAKALSDKNHELLGFLQDTKFIDSLLIRIPGEMERNCTEVEKGIANLPKIDTTEFGQAKTYLDNIRRNIDRLKQVTSNNSSAQEIIKSKENARKLAGDIATDYSYLDAILSNLLNRILENIGQGNL